MTSGPSPKKGAPENPENIPNADEVAKLEQLKNESFRAKKKEYGDKIDECYDESHERQVQLAAQTAETIPTEEVPPSLV